MSITETRAETDEAFVRTLPENWLRTDTILAVVVAFVSVLSLQTLRLTDLYEQMDVDTVAAQIFSLFISALLVFYRRYPITMVVLYTIAILVATFAATAEHYSMLFVGFMTLYSVGAWVSNRRLAFWVRLAVVVAQFGTIMVIMFFGDEIIDYSDEAYQDTEPGELLYIVGTSIILSLAYYLAAWYFGGRAWHRAKQRWQLQKAHDDLAEANEKIADAAVQAERMHIARELHDIIAHHVTVMGVHASAARRLVEADRDPEATVEQLGHIESSSARAVQELQTMVYTLRDQDGSAEPLPDLSELPELVRQANSTEQTVTFEVTGQQSEVSAATELTLYRVAQEALSNSRKHAGENVEVNVHLHYGETDVTLSVLDDGKAYEPVSVGTGTGVQGMKERVQAVDGTVEYGPRTPYGWQVVVRVPCAIRGES